MTFHTQVVGVERPAPGDGHRADARPRRRHPVELQLRAARRDDRLLGSAARPRCPVEMARGGRQRGLRVVAVTSVAQSMSVSRTPSSAAACSTRPTSSSTYARPTPTRSCRSTASTPRSARLDDHGRRHRQLHQGADRPAARGAGLDATCHHPRLGRRRRSLAVTVRRAYREHARRIARAIVRDRTTAR